MAASFYGNKLCPGVNPVRKTSGLCTGFTLEALKCKSGA